MANYTEHYNLVLPEADDVYDAEDYNENFNTIDMALLSLENQITTLANHMPSVVRSIHSFVMEFPANSTSTFSHEISVADPSRCVVLLDYLCDFTEGKANFRYTVSENAFVVTPGGYNTNKLTMQVQIIEFN